MDGSRYPKIAFVNISPDLSSAHCWVGFIYRLIPCEDRITPAVSMP